MEAERASRPNEKVPAAEHLGLDADRKASRREHTKHEPHPPGWLSKAKIRERLEKVDLFGMFKDARENFKDQGLSPDQSWQAAWQKLQPIYDDRVLKLASKSIAETIRPVEPRQVLAGAVFCDEESAAKGVAVNFRSDIEWVYRHLAHDVLPTEAPNSGAWRLLEWARSNEKDFFLGLFQKVLPTKAQLDEEQSKADDGGVIRLLDEVESISREMQKELAA